MTVDEVRQKREKRMVHEMRCTDWTKKEEAVVRDSQADTDEALVEVKGEELAAVTPKKTRFEEVPSSQRTEETSLDAERMSFQTPKRTRFVEIPSSLSSESVIQLSTQKSKRFKSIETPPQKIALSQGDLDATPSKMQSSPLKYCHVLGELEGTPTKRQKLGYASPMQRYSPGQSLAETPIQRRSLVVEGFDVPATPPKSCRSDLNPPRRPLPKGSPTPREFRVVQDSQGTDDVFLDDEVQCTNEQHDDQQDDQEDEQYYEDEEAYEEEELQFTYDPIHSALARDAARFMGVSQRRDSTEGEASEDPTGLKPRLRPSQQSTVIPTQSSPPVPKPSQKNAASSSPYHTPRKPHLQDSVFKSSSPLPAPPWSSPPTAISDKSGKIRETLEDFSLPPPPPLSSSSYLSR
ncbi:hypothetical protein K470DRAFT_260363 [Piedraia hortae CBS 480.64]|uniref:Uncharacterized protein n=1 Tax=Piedraia hortae CBS 480.64 TaxID=1314780 RepID=A0A6A7BT36_9PEZI|nr:hypothetical protein K470DRAFT_260363 [Piedraia hortae CBS 480.64]